MQKEAEVQAATPEWEDDLREENRGAEAAEEDKAKDQHVSQIGNKIRIEHVGTEQQPIWGRKGTSLSATTPLRTCTSISRVRRATQPRRWWLT